MKTPSYPPCARAYSLLTGLALALGACSAQPPQEPPPAAASAQLAEGCSSGALLDCPAGQLDGCANGTTSEHRCVPAGPGRCLDIRAALVRCNDGEGLTHDGCPEPAYMQRCAPKPGQAP
jgi:hypothetical protein